jgi:thiol:disulfide interchange protein
MPPAEPRAIPGGSTRARPTALLVLAAALLVARIGTGLYEERHPPSVAELVHWQPIEGAEARASAERRPVLYDFSADWCVPCQTMQREVFGDPEMAKQIESGFIPVRVLDRVREEGRNPALVDSLERRFRINSFPTLVVVPAGGGDPDVVVGYEGPRATQQRLRAALMRGVFPPSMRPPGTAR